MLEDGDGDGDAAIAIVTATTASATASSSREGSKKMFEFIEMGRSVIGGFVCVGLEEEEEG